MPAGEDDLPDELDARIAVRDKHEPGFTALVRESLNGFLQTTMCLYARDNGMVEWQRGKLQRESR
jgi:hypothetical protein